MLIALPIYLAVVGYLIGANKAPLVESKRHSLMILFLGFIGYFLSSWLNLKGLEHISVSLERLTLYTYPIFVAILGAIFFKTPLTKKLLFALCFTYIGLWTVFSEEAASSHGNVALGTTMVVLAALTFSFYILFSKRDLSITQVTSKNG